MGGFVSCFHPQAGLAMTCLQRSRAPFFTRWFLCCFISHPLTSWFCHLQSWGSPITDLKLFLSFLHFLSLSWFWLYRVHTDCIYCIRDMALPYQTLDTLWPSDLMVMIRICHFNNKSLVTVWLGCCDGFYVFKISLGLNWCKKFNQANSNKSSLILLHL